MDPNNHQGWYGEAFVRVLAAATGLRVAKPEPDLDGIDFCMWPDRVGRYGGARATPINAQVKSMAVAEENDAAHWGHTLTAAHFNILADEEALAFPTFLFLVIVPKEWQDWASAEPDGLLLRNAAYWHSLAGMDLIDEAVQGSKTVHVPKANLLTVESLRTLVGVPAATREGQVEAS